jgi:hypothetical protein
MLLLHSGVRGWSNAVLVAVLLTRYFYFKFVIFFYLIITLHDDLVRYGIILFLLSRMFSTIYELDECDVPSHVSINAFYYHQLTFKLGRKVVARIAI